MIGVLIWGTVLGFTFMGPVKAQGNVDVLNFRHEQNFAEYEGWSETREVKFWFRLDESKAENGMLLLYADIGTKYFFCVIAQKSDLEIYWPRTRPTLIEKSVFDGAWHKMHIKFNVSVTVDGLKKNLPFVDVPLILSKSIFIGGLAPLVLEKVNYALLNHKMKADCKYRCVRSFKGCIANFEYVSVNGFAKKPWLLKRNTADAGPCSACVKNACKNRGRCVDQASKFACECAGTGYEGDKCEREKTADVLRFSDPGSHIVYPLGGTNQTSYANVSFGFISDKQNGVLFHMGRCDKDWLQIELTGGEVNVRFNFGNGEKSINPKYAPVGECWHWVHLTYDGRNSDRTVVQVRVADGNVSNHVNAAERGRFLDADHNVAIFGGGLNCTKGSIGFQGYMEDIYFNGSSIPGKCEKCNKGVWPVSRGTIHLQNMVKSPKCCSGCRTKSSPPPSSTMKSSTSAPPTPTPSTPALTRAIPRAGASEQTGTDRPQNASVWTIVAVVFAAILAVGITIYIIYRWNNRYSGSFNPSQNNPAEEEGVVSGKNTHQLLLFKNPRKQQPTCESAAL